MQARKINDQRSIIKAYNMLLYFGGSMIMHEPTEECVADFWSQGILKKLPIKSSNPRFFKAASQLRESCTDKSLCSKMLKEDFIRLFKGPGLPLVSSRESDYSDRISDYSGKTGDNVTEFYNSYGWSNRARFSMPDDNLGIELLFLTLLTDKYIVLDDEACISEMRNEIRRFLRLHILSWIQEWDSRMQLYAGTLCYKGIATLIYACCEDIYEMLGAGGDGSVFPGNVRN